MSGPNVLVTGHPFVDVWAGIRPHLIGIDAWPDVPPGVPWKEGLCRALGTDVDSFWPHLRNRVRSYADLRPELVGAVEQLLDFVCADSGATIRTIVSGLGPQNRPRQPIASIEPTGTRGVS